MTKHTPVAWGLPNKEGKIIDLITPEEHERYEGGYLIPLYAAPQKKKNITRSKVLEIWRSRSWPSIISFAMYVARYE